MFTSLRSNSVFHNFWTLVKAANDKCLASAAVGLSCGLSVPSRLPVKIHSSQPITVEFQ